jgi:lysozyme
VNESWRDALRRQLMRHEGWVSHAYQDHLGYWTIGYGRLIDPSRGGGISQKEGELLLHNDIATRITALHQRLPYFQRLPSKVKQALANMSFQLGVNGLLGFRRMLAAVERKDWVAARREALDSNWARQTPKRAQEVAGMFVSQEDGDG